MKIISLANAKGGSGKTTCAALLCSGLSARGFRVALLDCDPLFPLYDWGRNASHTNVSAIKVRDTNVLAKQIKSMKLHADYVLVDLSGATSVMNALSFAHSDLVLIPMQGSAMDARGASHTIELVNLVAENLRIPINTSVLLTRVNPMVVTKSVKFATQIVEKLRVPFLEVPVVERSAYRDMFSLVSNLLNEDHTNVSNISKARSDIGYLTNAVTTCLRA